LSGSYSLVPDFFLLQFEDALKHKLPQKNPSKRDFWAAQLSKLKLTMLEDVRETIIRTKLLLIPLKMSRGQKVLLNVLRRWKSYKC